MTTSFSPPSHRDSTAIVWPFDVRTMTLLRKFTRSDQHSRVRNVSFDEKAWWSM